MNVGFRPRLKARPSLYDLIKNRNIDRLSAALSLSKLVDVGELPALPNSRPSTPIIERHPEPLHTPLKMPPKKEAKNADTDSEEQYGMSPQNIYKASKLMIAVQARSTPSLGMQLAQSCLAYRTDLDRPVVVAENMIGVAMYELVGSKNSSR